MNEVEHAGWEYKERNKHEETQFLFIHRLLCGRHFRAVLCNGICGRSKLRQNDKFRDACAYLRRHCAARYRCRHYFKATLIKVLFETDYSSSVSLVSLEKCAESLDRMSAVLSFVLPDSSVSSSAPSLMSFSHMLQAFSGSMSEYSTFSKPSPYLSSIIAGTYMLRRITSAQGASPPHGTKVL